MPRMTFTHFEAALIFAVLISIVLGVVTIRPTAAAEAGASLRQYGTRERLRYGLKCLGYFFLALFGLGWLMYFLHR